MSDNYKVKRVSEETRMNIQRKSAYTLPNRPTEQGMKPNELKRAFYGFVTEANNSMISEMNRVVDEANKALDEEEKGRTTHENDKNNPHQVTKTQVGLGKVNNTSDIDKPISNATRKAFEEHNSGTNLDSTSTHPELRKLIQDAVNEHNQELEVHNNSQDEANNHPYIHQRILEEKEDRVYQDKLLREELLSQVRSRIPFNAIHDGLDSTDKQVPLSANQGRILNESISVLSTKVQQETIKSIEWDSANYILKIVDNNGKTLTVDLPVESVVKDVSYDANTKQLTFELVNGNTLSIDASDLVDTYTADGKTITLEGKQFKIASEIIKRLENIEKAPGCVPVSAEILETAPETLYGQNKSYEVAINGEIRDVNIGNFCLIKYKTENSKKQRIAIGMISDLGNYATNGKVEITAVEYLDGELGAQGERGISITNIAKEGEDTLGGYIYTITLSDGSTKQFVAPKGASGVGIATITPNGQDANGGNRYLVSLTNGQGYDFTAPRGDTGLEALTFNEVLDYPTDPIAGPGFAAEYKYFNRKPIVGDIFQIIGRSNASGGVFALICQITSLDEGWASYTILSIANIRGMTGAIGPKGDKGEKGEAKFIRLSDNTATAPDTVPTEPVTLSWAWIDPDCTLTELNNGIYPASVGNLIIAECGTENSHGQKVLYGIVSSVDGSGCGVTYLGFLDGATGATGPDVLMYNTIYRSTTKPAINSIINIEASYFNRTPKTNDQCIVVYYHSNSNTTYLCNVKKISTTNNFLITAVQSVQGAKGDKGDKGDTGAPFTIAKTYASIAAMETGYSSDGVAVGSFVLIDTGNIEDEDNAKLYVKGDSSYTYITDLSGATGLKGERGDKGDTGAQGIQGEKGDKGDKGDTGAKIVSTVLQGQDANGGNIYKQTFDNGTTATFTAPKGEKGDTGAIKCATYHIVGTNGTSSYDFYIRLYMTVTPPTTFNDLLDHIYTINYGKKTNMGGYGSVAKDSTTENIAYLEMDTWGILRLIGVNGLRVATDSNRITTFTYEVVEI